MSSLKAVSGVTWDRVIQTWTQQLRNKSEFGDGSTHPYQVVNIEMVAPGRDQLEDFEARRNELDQRVAKLETIQAFYAPSTEEVLQRILKEGFSGAFAGELTFCPDATQAIQESLSVRPINKLLLCRVVLGSKGVDYTEIHGKYRIKFIRGVMPSFLITFKPFEAEGAKPVPEAAPRWPSEPSRDQAPEPVAPPKEVSMKPLTAEENPEIPGGRQCDFCTKWHQWNARYCTRCGARLDLNDRVPKK
eukprot:TRINITY_DN1174_c0_g1_i1.p1 TRINITY_DN1174_c0_g1~~TRINITY_DN1174_c0_g1_i1.p1  ORF type:complete len:265 (-),score=70.31 TRINITY_DN1174_c0_g1_i1:56-793(-)